MFQCNIDIDKSASVPDGPARVVFGKEGEVVLDALEVFPLLALGRVGVAVEGEANDLQGRA